MLKAMITMDKLKVFGLTYAIERVPYISRDEYRAGEIDFEKQEIRILDSLSVEHQKQTIIHEMIHAIFVGLGMNDYSDNEALVQSLATALHQCLTENHGLI